MKLAYGKTEVTGATNEVAKKILDLLVGADITYQEAEAALELAQEMLQANTKPKFSSTPR